MTVGRTQTLPVDPQVGPVRSVGLVTDPAQVRTVLVRKGSRQGVALCPPLGVDAVSMRGEIMTPQTERVPDPDEEVVVGTRMGCVTRVAPLLQRTVPHLLSGHRIVVALQTRGGGGSSTHHRRRGTPMGVVADQASLVQSRVEVLVALPRVVVALDAQLGGLLREVLRECAAVGDRLVALGAVRDRLVEHHTLGRLAVGVASLAEVCRLVS
jgi:hypothetical protein